MSCYTNPGRFFWRKEWTIDALASDLQIAVGGFGIASFLRELADLGEVVAVGELWARTELLKKPREPVSTVVLTPEPPTVRRTAAVFVSRSFDGKFVPKPAETKKLPGNAVPRVVAWITANPGHTTAGVMAGAGIAYWALKRASVDGRVRSIRNKNQYGWYPVNR